MPHDNPSTVAQSLPFVTNQPHQPSLHQIEFLLLLYVSLYNKQSLVVCVTVQLIKALVVVH